MQVQWKKALPKLVVWLAAEVLLTCMGLDDLADCGEFVFERGVVVEMRSIVPGLSSGL